MKIHRNHLAIWLAACVLQACSLLSPVAPETLPEQLAYATASVTAGFHTLADLRERGSISAEQGYQMFTSLENAATMIRLARDAVGAGNQEVADKRLASAMAILLAVEREMKEAQNK